jgi:plastocyanin
MKIRAAKIAIVTAVASAALWGSSGIAVAGGGCHTPSTASRGDTVDIVDLCFVSTVLYVEPGTNVTWTNRDSIEHDVVGVGDAWGDPGISLSSGDDVSYRFDQDGVYPYACWFHPGMVGAIVVGDGVGSDLAAVVPATSGGDAGSADAASSTLARSSGSSGATAIWIVGTALVVGALAGAFVVAMRNRRKVTVAG